MNRLSLEKRTKIIGMLLEGNSPRAISRLENVSINTVTKLLVDIGTACQEYHDEHIRNVPLKRVQCDEIWSFIYTKDKNLPENFHGKYGVGSIWTWVGLDADSRPAISWLVGNRHASYARVLIQDITARLKNREQLTMGGLKAYLDAVDESFGTEIDFAQHVKLYGKSLEGEHRYSPAEWTGTQNQVSSGNPRLKHIPTSYVEWRNLTMRMNMRRFTRLTNAFSIKVEHHAHAIALHFMHYNYCRTHKTLRITPVMSAGISKHLWSIEDLARLLEISN